MLILEYSRIIGELLYLFGRKNGPVFTNINIADIAAPTLAKAAFHAVFKSRVDMVERKTEIGKFRESKFDSDGRTTDYGKGIFG